MKKTAKITFPKKTALLLFAIAAPLLLLEKFGWLSINHIGVRFLLFYICVSAMPIIIADSLGYKKGKALLIIMLSTLLICFLIAFLSWNGDWKTQTIIYRHRSNPERTIEFRMRRDPFSVGYSKQIVARERVLPFIDIIKETDTAKINTTEWKWVNQQTNELKIPGDYINLPEK